MAIAFDNATGPSTAIGSTTNTFSHTNTGDNITLFVGFSINTTSDLASGVTYAGQAMTQVATVVQGQRSYLYVLENAPTGANNVVVTLTSSANSNASASSYTGAGAVTTQGTNSNSSASSLALTLTSTVDNSWMVAFGRTTSTGVVNAGANTTERNSSNMFDNNADITPAGNNTLNISTDASQAIMIVGAIFQPFVAPTGGSNPIFFSSPGFGLG